MNNKEVFTDIYDSKIWKSDIAGTLSGPGSDIECSYEYVEFLNKFINKHKIKSVLDLGCGDFNLMRHVNLKNIDYLGIDVDEYSAACLVKIPLEKYKFKVITIEHDSYRFGAGLCNVQRDILSYYGYTLVCKNITCLPLLENQYFEDWWVY